MQRKYFGTDGIRGRVGVTPITPEFVLKLGWALGMTFKKHDAHAKVVIGKDTRLSGYLFESALEAGLSAAGVDILLLGPMPTPGIAYLTQTLHAQAGIVISASHNPYEDNGVKFFSSQGKKISNELELEIEAQLEQPLETVPPDKLGRAKRISDAQGRYIEFCKSKLAKGTDFKGMKIILDCANGATYNIAPMVFHELGADVIDVASSPDGLNINECCGSTYPENLRTLVLAEQAALGIAFDGDGDRVIMVDHKGDIVNGDELIYIIARYVLNNHIRSKGVVGTVMSNLGMELALSDLGFEFSRTPVGDRYVIEEMEKRDWLIGGEASGHIICRHLTTTGDGIIAALQVLTAICQTGQSLHELKSGMKKFPQELINVRVMDQTSVTENPTVQEAVKKVEAQLAGKGRVLLRPSGTEPVVRVMVEGEDAEKVICFAKEIAKQVEQAA